MNYQETIEYLYNRLPVFQHIGARAFKPGLHTTRALCAALGDPQNHYPTIHVGGTNGKGSTSHMLAAILQECGYKVGLYTSPHLKDFRERIRVDGICIGEEFVVDFTNEVKSYIDELNPSFFEVTVAMAFKYFEVRQVDIAVIEVGMGGRLDSTNIIEPILSIITNISMDHTQFLGDTPAKIAGEKAGIIKNGVPVIISERQSDEISKVFIEKAAEQHADLTFGSDRILIKNAGPESGLLHLSAADSSSENAPSLELRLDLSGSYQLNNIKGVLAAVTELRRAGWQLPDASVQAALSKVSATTGLKGRWQKLMDQPVVYCDTAHNLAGLTSTIGQFATIPHRKQRFVLGFVSDKDISSILELFPVMGIYYFCQPSNLRALNATELREMALKYALKGDEYQNVNEALEAALADAAQDDAIYVGGSTFVVADLNNL